MSAKLFSESIKEIHKDSELASLQAEYPEYDPGYLCQAAGFSRRPVKEWMEKLWTGYAPFADSQFLVDFRRQFAQRSWELYLGATFLNRGLTIGKHSDHGPDYRLEKKDGNLISWVEAVAPAKGLGADRVPEMTYGVSSSIPEEEMILRIAQVLDKKIKKYRDYVLNRVVGPDDPYVIAINRSGLDYLDPFLPLGLKIAFGIGHPTLRIKVGSTRLQKPQPSWSGMSAVKKLNGASVNTQFFLNPEHACISALIYCSDNILNSPRTAEEMGENFVTVHNPFAKNPLRPEFPFGKIYRANVRSGNIKLVRQSKDWVKPDPFEYLNN